MILGLSNRQAMVAAGVAGLAAFLIARPTVAFGGALTLDQVGTIYDQVKAKYGAQIKVDKETVQVIAWIESAYKPNAVRFEPHIVDTSVGVMQVLIATAQQMWATYNAFGAGKGDPFPVFSTLLDPRQSMTWGMLYLSHLKTWRGYERNDRWVIRAYNGGPGGAQSTATASYYKGFLKARDHLRKTGSLP